LKSKSGMVVLCLSAQKCLGQKEILPERTIC